MARHRICFIVIITFINISCNTQRDEKPSEDVPGGSITFWSSKTELFMEYPALIVGKMHSFAVHLTWLADFKPVSEGKLTLEFHSTDGIQVVTSSGKPTSPGIYRPTVKFDRAGSYDLRIFIDGKLKDTLHIEDIPVFASISEVSAEEVSPPGEHLVPFLKEQQWKIDFRTETVHRQSISGTVRAACEIVPRLKSEAFVTAPFTGTIPVEENQNLPVVGSSISQNGRLVSMLPAIETPGGHENFTSRFVEVKTEWALAKEELARASQLFKKQLISEKEYLEIEAAFKRVDASYTLMRKNIRLHSDEASIDDFTLRAPLAGKIIEANVVPGKHVVAGETLYRIIDTRSVWVRASVASTEIGALKAPKRAWVKFPGIPKLFEIDEKNGRLISVAPAIDRLTRVFPVVFEVRNSEENYRIGMFGEITIETGEEREAIVIPESALIEEEGSYSVFVHVEGEAFAKREVTIGVRNGQLVEVLNGLSEGERIVTVGAYQVKLAALSTQLPAHGHAH